MSTLGLHGDSVTGALCMTVTAGVLHDLESVIVLNFGCIAVKVSRNSRRVAVATLITTSSRVAVERDSGCRTTAGRQTGARVADRSYTVELREPRLFMLSQTLRAFLSLIRCGSSL